MTEAPDQFYQRLAGSVTVRGSELSLTSWVGDAEPLSIALPDATTGVARRLTAFIYANFYAGEPRLEEAVDPLVAMGARLADPEFWSELGAANPGRGYYDPGWEVCGVDPEHGITVHKSGISLLIDEQRHLRQEDLPVAPTRRVSVRFPKDGTMAAPGFYVAYGDAGPAAGARQTRIYLNLRHSLAAELIRGLLHRLNAAGLRFTLKVFAERARFDRRDNTVLYINRDDFSAAAPIALCRRAQLPEAFRTGVPGLVKPLGPGIGVADNPLSADAMPEESFGLHRSRLLAEAIAWAAPAINEQTRASSDAVHAAILQRFDDEGIDPWRPHLNSRDSQDYEDCDRIFTPAHGLICGDRP